MPFLSSRSCFCLLTILTMIVLCPSRRDSDSSMADSSYDMNPGWNQTQPNPQLENEFDHSVRNVVPESTQRFSSPQGPQDISYPTYQQQYQQQSFTFTVPIRQVDQQYNESGFFDQQVSPSRQPQAARPFAPARNVYSDPSSSLQDAHLPQAIYRDNSRGYTYPQHSHHSGLGQLQGGVEHTGITPAHHEFAGGDNAQRSRPPSVFVSPPTNNYDLYQSPPQEQPMDQQLSIHRPNDRFFGSRDTVQDDPVAPANKRPRGLEDTAGSYKDGDGPDQDPENKGDAQKPKP